MVQGISRILVPALALSTVLSVGCSRKEETASSAAAPAKVAAIKVDPSLITDQEAQEFAARSREDFSKSDESTVADFRSSFISKFVCGSEMEFAKFCETEKNTLFGMALNTALTGQEVGIAKRKKEALIAKEGNLRATYANVVAGQNREATLPLVTRAWNLSFQPHGVGIASSSNADSALFAVVLLSAIKADYNNSFDGLTPAVVDQYAKDLDFSKVYQEIAATNHRLDVLSSHVDEVESRLKQLVADEASERIAADKEEARVRLEQITRTKNAIETLQSNIATLTVLQKELGDYSQGYTDWKDALTKAESQATKAKNTYKQLQADLNRAQVEYSGAQEEFNKTTSNTLTVIANKRQKRLDEAFVALNNAQSKRDEAEANWKAYEALVNEAKSHEPQKPEVKKEKPVSVDLKVDPATEEPAKK